MMKRFDLYKITIGSQEWRFTNSSKPQNYDSGDGSRVYEPIPITRSIVEQKNTISKANITVTIPIDHALSILLLTSYSEQIIGLTVFTNSGGITEVTWKGRMAAIKPGDAYLEISFESIFTSLRRPGLRAKYQKTCRHTIYGDNCGVDIEDFREAATVSSITGTSLVIPEAATFNDNYFTGGIISTSDDVMTMIVKHTGTAIELQRISYDLKSKFDQVGSGLSVSLFPGCARNRSDCLNRFNNILNFGGFSWIPKKNPMGGTSIT